MRITIREKDATRFSKNEAFQKGKEFVQEGYRVRDADIFLRDDLHEHRWRFSVYADNEYNIQDLEKNWYVVRLYLEMSDGNLVRVGYLV